MHRVLLALLVLLVAAGDARAAAPGNDNQAAATVLTGANLTVTGTNVEATTEGGETGHYNLTGSPTTAAEPYASVWYRWTAPATGYYTFDTCGATFDVALALYTDGVPLANLSRNNFDACDRAERVGRLLQSGQHLMIAVDGVLGATGTFTLDISVPAPPPNDAFALPRTLTGATATDTVPVGGATAEGGEPAHAGTAAFASAWWTWTAPAAGSYVIDTCQPGAWADSYGRRIAVYTQGGSGFGGLTAVAQNGSSQQCGDLGLTGVVTVTATAGQDFVIAVDGLSAEKNPLSHVNVRPVSSPGNDMFAAAAPLTGPTASGSADTDDATTEGAAEPSHNGTTAARRSVWWAVTVPVDGDYRIDVSTDFHASFAFRRQTGSGFADLLQLERRALARQFDEQGRGLRDFRDKIQQRLLAGQTYYLAVDGRALSGELPGGGHVDVELSPLAAPGNDAFAAAVPLTGPNQSVAVNTVGATLEGGEPPRSFDSGSGRTVWFTWVAPASGMYLADLCNPDVDFGTITGGFGDLSVFAQTGTGLAGLQAVPEEVGECDGEFGLGSDRLEFSATADTTYAFRVDGPPNGAYSPFDLHLRPIARPDNDALASARLLEDATDADTGTSVDATYQSGEADDLRAGSVWWKWTPPALGRYVVESCGSGVPTELRMYRSAQTDPIPAQLLAVGRSVGANSCPRGGRVVLDHTVAGRTYWIAVDGRGYGDRGPVSVSVRPAQAPGNDDFAAAAPLAGVGVSATASNVEATAETGEQAHVAGVAANRTVWWKWTAPSADPVIVDACGSDFDTVLAVHTGTAVNALTKVADNQNATACSPRSRLTFTPVSGTEYRIAVGANGAEENRSGTVELAIRSTAAPGNDDFAGAFVVPPEGGTIAGHNVNATRETGEPSGEQTVWWKWTAPATGRYALESCTTSALNRFAFTPQIYRQNGSGVSGLVVYPTQELSFCDGERLDFTVTADKTLYFRVGVSGVSGAFAMVLKPAVRPANDDFARAATLTGTAAFAEGDNTEATAEGGEPSHGTGADGRSVWWKWTAPDAEGYEVVTACSPVMLTVGAYTGPSVRELSRRGTRFRESCPGGEQRAGVRFTSVAGTTYTFAVDGDDPGVGPFGLTLQPAGSVADITPPQTTIDSGPAAGAVLTTGSATFAFSSDEPGSTFQCRLFGLTTVFTACNSGTASFTALPTGSYRFDVKAKDAAGNEDPSPASRSFSVDLGVDPEPTPTSTATATATATASPGPSGSPEPTATASPGPTVAPPGALTITLPASLKATKNKTVTLTLTGLPAGTVLTGRLGPAKATGAKLVFKLARKARKALTRKGRFKAALTVAARAPSGATGSAKKTVTVKGKKKKKKKKR